MSDEQSIIIDNGSSIIKAGLSGKHQPSVKFTSVVGTPIKNKNWPQGVEYKSKYIGDDAEKMRRFLNLAYPTESGKTNWDDMENVWEHLFLNELRIDP